MLPVDNVELRQISDLKEIVSDYDTILCDVWGVLHNGVSAFSPASAALHAAREAGKTVVLITNSPRLHDGVATQLDALGVDRRAWDAIVTSGDVTRTLIAEAPRAIFHLGPERDRALFEGLDVDLVGEHEALAIACTGLFDDETETPDDYAEMLKRFHSRDVPFICVNPDVVVERGDRLVFCSGALARDYALLGGRTLIAGKPHGPIYERAFAVAENCAGRPIDARRTLAIGDGMSTDVKGAMDAGLDVLFVSNGIHAREYGEPGRPDPDRLAGFLADFGAAPVATMIRLQ